MRWVEEMRVLESLSVNVNVTDISSGHLTPGLSVLATEFSVDHFQRMRILCVSDGRQ